MIVIKGGRILKMGQSGFIDNGLLIIEGDRIKAVGSGVEIPSADCQIIDATGKFICPGFIDAHTHIGLEEEIYGVEGDDVNETSNPITAELQAIDGINFDDLAFKDALRGGVTRSMSMPGSANIIGGQAVFLKHWAAKMGDMIYKNPWGLKAALGENPKRVYGKEKKTPITRMANASLLREAFYTAANTMDKADMEPILEYKLQPIYRVLRQEIPLLLHAHRADDILTALRIKDEFGFDLIIQHGTEAFKIADELIKRNVPVFLGPLLVNRAKVEMQEVSFKSAALLARMGVEFCFITDHPVIPIEYLRVCAALAVRDGLDENQALAAITDIPAKLLKVDNELGSIQQGKRADLAIFSGHPFDFRTKVDLAIVDGMIWSDGSE